jgi:hypothetical protein
MLIASTEAKVATTERSTFISIELMPVTSTPVVARSQAGVRH